MKRAVTFAFILIFVFSGASFAQAPAGKVDVCQIVAIEGQVSIESSGSSRGAVKGEYLEEGVTISTGSSSFVILAYDPAGKNLVQVGEKSTVKIVSIRPTDLALKTGELMAKLKNLGKGETFEISTPVCVAAVRGTAYSVNHAVTAGSLVRSFERNIDVFNLDKQGEMGSDNIVLRQGHKIFVDLEGRFGKIDRLGNTDYSQRETFDKRSNEAAIRGVQQQNPPPSNAHFEEPKGGEPQGGINMNNAFGNMDKRAGDIQTSEINQQIVESTKDQPKEESSHYSP